MIDREALARRALDMVLSVDERAALRVWADQLEAAGDPRGVLIALEHAEHAEPHRRHALRKAGLAHAIATGMLGAVEALARMPRALALEWRAGQLYGLALDLHRVPGLKDGDCTVRIARLLEAPICRALRRFSVRGRGRPQVEGVLDGAAWDFAYAPPLEELIVFTEGSLRTSVDRGTYAAPHVIASLLARYPALRWFADGSTYALPSPALSPVEVAGMIARATTAEPETAQGRAALGRALLSTQESLRSAALTRIMQLGPRAAALAETLVYLIRASQLVPKLPLALALGQLGAEARPCIPALAALTGRAAHSAETRRAAGLALAMIAPDPIQSPTGR